MFSVIYIFLRFLKAKIRSTIELTVQEQFIGLKLCISLKLETEFIIWYVVCVESEETANNLRCECAIFMLWKKAKLDLSNQKI